jgi:DNA-directed RNA polymerase subunit H (RpoH/RPB5)
MKNTEIIYVQKRGFTVDPGYQRLMGNYKTFVAHLKSEYDRSERRTYRELLSMSYTSADGKVLYIYYAATPSSETIGKETILTFREKIEEFKADQAIIVTALALGSAAADEFLKLRNPLQLIHAFNDSFLMFDHSKHVFIPESHLLSSDEKKKFLDTTKIALDKLPIICANDPIVVIYGARNNDIIRSVNMKSQLDLHPDVSYRRVIVGDMPRAKKK